MATGVFQTCSGSFDTVVTWTLPSWSKLSWFSGWGVVVWNALQREQRQPERESKANHASRFARRELD